jgi:hypothetical protein
MSAVYSPVIVPNLPFIKEIAAATHSLFLVNNGSVLGAGSNFVTSSNSNHSLVN